MHIGFSDVFLKLYFVAAKPRKELKMKKLINFIKKEDGQGMVEYGLIIGLIAVIVVAALVLLGPKIAGLFDGIGDAIDSAVTSGS